MRQVRHSFLTPLCDLPVTRGQLCLGVVAPTCLWLVFLVDYLNYDGFSRNDTAAHRIYVDQVMRMLQGSGLNLDHWFNASGVGSPLFRVYQHLPHVFAGWLALKMGWNASHAVHFLIAVAWAFQFPAWYLSARWMGLSRMGSLLVVWFAPLIQAWLGLGHELRSYLFYGFGLFTQAVAFPFFILFWGAGVRLLGFGASWKTEPSRRHFALMGASLGFVFLLHHYYGYIALLFFAVGWIAALFTKHMAFPKRMFGNLFVLFLAFFVVTAYQVLSIVEDIALQHEVLFYTDPERTLGFGWEKVLRLLVTGAFLDSHRIPILSFFALGGLVYLWRKQRSRAYLFGVPLVVSIFFMSGKEGLGVIARVVPGLGFINPERFVVVAQICGVFLAVHGALVLGDWIFHRNWTSKMKGLAWGFAALPLAYLYYDRAEYVSVNRVLILSQREADKALSQPMLAALRAEGGRLWSPQKAQNPGDARALPHLGSVIYDSLLAELGIPIFTRSTDTVSYGSETPLFFEKSRRADYEVFNVRNVLLDRKEAPPPFYDKVMDLDDVTLYRAPSRGVWDVIRISKLSVTRDETTWYLLLRDWLQSGGPANRMYESFVPYKAAAVYPESVPKLPVSANLSVSIGEVRSQSPIEDGRSRAILEATDDSQFGLLRAAYHPRWQILRNGIEVSPVWAGPGYLAFPLVKGENHIEARFLPDPLRDLLFSASLAALTLLAVGLVVISLKSIRVFQRFQNPSGSVV